jgi:Spy/CpxP family protein refolding chaperone
MKLFTRKMLSTLVLGTALLGGAAAYAVDHMANPHAAIDASAHMDRMLKHLYVEIDATDAQKAQIDPIVKQAMQDLMPLHAQLHSAHAQALQLLSAPTVDRAALESMRAQNMALVDQASKRVVKLIADVADVLTPAQRQKLADHLQHMHSRMGGHHM